MIDRFTRWPEAIPLQDCIVGTMAKMFFTHWIARFGTSCLITLIRILVIRSVTVQRINQTHRF